MNESETRKNRQHSIERYNVTFIKQLNKNNENENEKNLHHHNAFKVFIALT